MLRTFTDRLYIFFYRGVWKKKQLKIRFLGRCFGFLSFWRIKNSYLIRPLLKNSKFLWKMFLCPKDACKK